jgi:hypothetical protein
MKTSKSLLSIALLAALAGCSDSGGGEGDGSQVERISFTGLVADGYLDGATVCLDLDNNKECGANEPTATSGAGGAFTMDDATQAQRDTYPLLVEVVVGTTIDEDNAGVVLTKPLTLSAPVGYGFISPLSTMVQNEVEGGATASAAETAVQAKLGTTLSLNEDYIAAQESGDFTAEQEAEFAQLHQVAQVTARVISDNMETLATAAEENNISLDDLISAIVDQVFDALDEIATKVEVIVDAGTPFDPDAVATEVNDELVDLAPETIAAQVDQNQAEEAATSVSIVDVMKNGGISWLGAEFDNDIFTAEYGTLEFNTDGSAFTETAYYWLTDQFVLDNRTETPDASFILNSAGEWVELVGGNDNGDFSAQADGSIEIEYGTSAASYVERLSGIEIDIAGLNTRLIANSADDEEGIWGDYLLNTAVFPAGSKGYQLVDEGSDEPYIFEDYNDCGGTLVGGLCNYTYLQDGPGSIYGEVATFAEITSATGYVLTDGASSDILAIKAVEIAYYDNNDKVWAEIITGGAVNYYKVNSGQTAITLLGSATWAMVTGSVVVMELQPISAIQGIDIDSEFEEGNPVLAIINGYIRNAAHEQNNSSENVGVRLLNNVAIAAITGSNFSLSNYIGLFTTSLTGLFNVSYTDGTASYTFTDGTNGSVQFFGEPSEEAFTWSIDSVGRLIVNLTVAGDTDRYTLLSGTIETGEIQLEISGDGGSTYPDGVDPSSVGAIWSRAN